MNPLRNLKKLIKFYLKQNNVLNLVKYFPYIMYSVRNINRSTRWSVGKFYYKDKFNKSKMTIDEFYKHSYI